MSPRASVTTTVAPTTGRPLSPAFTAPASTLVQALLLSCRAAAWDDRQKTAVETLLTTLTPLSRMSYASGSPSTTTVEACGWNPSVEAISTYGPVPGVSTA